MDRAKERVKARGRIRKRIRRKVRGSAERPRLVVYKSLKYIYVQAIDDETGVTLASASSLEKEMKGKSGGANTAAARAVGALIADRVKGKGITRVVFDRGGYLFHGNVKALADAAREKGLEF
ncbi:MAG TPA: 50S ribosomal protein L18 [Thermoanaerobaculia bacterium]|nr:50S ribosomal protein L18 [Thermoanaerobaculia bacterium]